MLLLINGTEAPYCWIFSATALGLSYACPLSSWRTDEYVEGGEGAEGGVLRSTVFAAEILTYAADVVMRIHFRRGVATSEEATCRSV